MVQTLWDLHVPSDIAMLSATLPQDRGRGGETRFCTFPAGDPAVWSPVHGLWLWPGQPLSASASTCVLVVHGRGVRTSAGARAGSAVTQAWVHL